MKKIVGWLIGIVIVIIMLIPIIAEYTGGGKIRIISYDQFVTLFDHEEGISLVYFGNPNDENFKDVQETLKIIRDEFGGRDGFEIFVVDHATISEEDLEEIRDYFETEVAYVLIVDGRLSQIIEGDTTLSDLRTMMDMYINFIIPENSINYNQIRTFAEFERAVNGRNPRMIVFGTDDCPWAGRYRVMLNDLLDHADLRIYYINLTEMDQDYRFDLEQILDSGIKIPAECTAGDEDQPLSQPFGTPLTLFTRRGEVIDCIGGYVNAERLIPYLSRTGMLE